MIVGSCCIHVTCRIAIKLVNSQHQLKSAALNVQIIQMFLSSIINNNYAHAYVYNAYLVVDTNIMVSVMVIISDMQMH